MGVVKKCLIKKKMPHRLFKLKMKSSIQLSRLAHRKHITYLLCYLLFASEDTGVSQEFNDVFKVSNLMGMELQVL